jgi:hypothetical protein
MDCVFRAVVLAVGFIFLTLSSNERTFLCHFAPLAIANRGPSEDEDSGLVRQCALWMATETDSPPDEVY